MSRNFRELPPLSLYVHIPWCVKKCPYCDFNSHEQRGDIPEQHYIDALLNDLADELPLVWGRSISTVFIGGGTPSLLSAAAVERLMSGIRALTALAPTVEITMEANPGTFEQQRFRDYRESGINRLSIGIQSFNPQALKTLGRVHSADEALRAVDIAKQAGFEEINLDLMFGLPEQSTSAALADLRTAIDLETTHLSCYELTLEPNTLFARFPPKLPDDEARADMQNEIIDTLTGAGFERYEISAYARTSHRSQHNVNYWQFGDYLGIGAGAHGKISSAADGTIVRRWKHKHPARYLEATCAAERLGSEDIISLEETGLEFMMNALRLVDGFPVPLFEQHTGTSLLPWQSTIDKAIERGLLERSGLQLKATPTGFNWLNDTLEMFLPGVRRYPVIPLNPIS
ncbi:radical SAM family heme chaperone HemW [Granulosicoccus antarcticus]|uniref:Heme chaperone HemW n=1 Tax=Granulosicoccus antarcticus IMCC3135 TaxID=1192854 RepID=A0A2Z2NIZ8_9GAMM|nr:radical SAM family heme chaperone HemW [Granulosicoccus antarcticus]ASJ70465.1 Oxygen-independent coproporphyrinogen-III oxidase-like protein [Granulosicoccus antarcticus IMCC3135]